MSRHADVEQRDLGLERARDRQGRFTAVRRTDLVPGETQQHRQRVRRVLVVVGDEDLAADDG